MVFVCVIIQTTQDRALKIRTPSCESCDESSIAIAQYILNRGQLMAYYGEDKTVENKRQGTISL